MIIGQCEPEGRLSLILKVLNGLKNKTVLVGLLNTKSTSV